MGTFQQTLHTTVIVIMDVEHWMRFTLLSRSLNRLILHHPLKKDDMFCLMMNSTYKLWLYRRHTTWIHYNDNVSSSPIIIILITNTHHRKKPDTKAQ